MTDAVLFLEPHVWVSEYETCDKCNYQDHRCHFCGEDLDHESFDPKGQRHWLSDCRPDLVEHEVGELCTWPAYIGEYAYLNEELGRPSCYAYEDRDGNKGEDHIHFYTDGPMV